MAEAQQDPQPVFTIEKIYVKDLCIEVPNTPQVFLERDTPRVKRKRRSFRRRTRSRSCSRSRTPA